MRGTAYLDDRPEGAFLAREGEGDSFLPWLRSRVEKQIADSWVPLEPDIEAHIYPPRIGPARQIPAVSIAESELVRRRREARQVARAANGGRLPDDIFTFVVRVDSQNFQGVTAFSG
jgi:hypothetical protein